MGPTSKGRGGERRGRGGETEKEGKMEGEGREKGSPIFLFKFTPMSSLHAGIAESQEGGGLAKAWTTCGPKMPRASMPR